jgi:hypothetical protein
MSKNLDAMIRRKALMREDTEESEQQAQEILEDVLRNGGLTTEESYILMLAH